MALNAKAQRFAEVFAGNGTEAARLAGYAGSDAVLATQAGRLLRTAEVLAIIKARQEKEVRPLVASRQERQAFWTRVMQGHSDTVADPEGGTCTFRLSMSDRLKASELLGRSEADFTDKVAGADGGPLEIVVRLENAGDED